MEEPELFIEKITINEVRHLKDVEIPISVKERKHLILTGKNGSGKTSVLERIKSEFENEILFNLLEQILSVDRKDILSKSEIKKLSPILDSLKGVEELIAISKNKKLTLELEVVKNKLLDLSFNIRNFSIKKELSLSFSDDNKKIEKAYNLGKFILASFDAKRNFGFKVPEGGKKINFKNSYDFKEKVSSHFLQYLVNLKTDQSFAKNEKNIRSIKQIDKWFTRFERTLKYLFDDSKLELKFNQKNFDFELILGNGQVADFNTLSDGYAAILNIITELMLRMEGKIKNVYDIQGIVLIDEVETHLHIDLQKKILPFLTSFFPKIQFIVSTHSPFVISSLSNAVVYDLENHTRFEDLSEYPIDGIVEGYFDNDKYSAVVTKKVQEYEALTEKDILTEQEEKKRYKLFKELNDVSGKLAPELKMKFQQIQLKRLAKTNG